MNKKISEQVTQISGVDTDPFRRYVDKINLDYFMIVLKEEKIKAESNGYSDLELLIKEDRGIVDIYLYGKRDLTEDEKDTREIIAVMTRAKDKTSKGLTRDDLLKQR